MRQTQLYDRINEGMRWGRLYGGAAGLILIRGQEDLSKPLELDTILPGTFAGLYIVDRWSGITPGMELVSDLADLDFGLPNTMTSIWQTAVRWYLSIIPASFALSVENCHIWKRWQKCTGENLKWKPFTRML
ncbi:MAG: anti-CBASS Acb1 family protein [Anaerotignum sp.]